MAPRLRLNHSRVYFEPVGPPTALIDPAVFEAQSTAALAQAQEALVAFDAMLDLSHAREEIALRCSVEDLYEETSTLHEDATTLSEVKAWHEERLFPTGHGEHLDEDDPADGQIDDERDEDGPEKEIPVDGAPRKSRVDPKVAALLEEAKTSSVQILKPIKDIGLFLRKTKTPDYNTLNAPREAPLSITANTSNDSPLASIIYTISMLPIPRITNRSPFTTRAQTLHLLGSTTLWELKENLRAGGEGIPSVAPKDSDDDLEDNHWGAPPAKTKWTDKHRVAGAVWGIEGYLYGDQEDGKKDYAEMVCELIDSTEWASKRQNRQASDDIDVSGQPSNEYVSDGGDGDQSADHKPQWVAGESMQLTMIGELDLKLGEPYWFMHQGNCEHVWTVDQIRHIHPSDPRPTSTLSTAPYPITTFLSRGNDAKCRLCDRDPGSIVTLNDELAGETPALLCATCFEHLHGDNADNHVEVVPTLLEL